MVDKLVSSSSYSWPVANIEVQNANGINFLNLYATTDRVYDEAQKLSRAFPKHRVSICIDARFKVFFKNGEPTGPVKAMTEFYSNLTPEEIEESKIHVGGGVWI